ncbi:hypothetical protein E2C01_002415 [Portunus trituberculatus]|uniref:Uncharacterized protein n=1 Tax=Portunus trituberculatus TaxID=210409 RepID=A0A5B7CN68_PORTR|nr:hypothetical protein [Portunus trituberculatus]
MIAGLLVGLQGHKITGPRLTSLTYFLAGAGDAAGHALHRYRPLDHLTTQLDLTISGLLVKERDSKLSTLVKALNTTEEILENSRRAQPAEVGQSIKKLLRATKHFSSSNGHLNYKCGRQKLKKFGRRVLETEEAVEFWPVYLSAAPALKRHAPADTNCWH